MKVIVSHLADYFRREWHSAYFAATGLFLLAAFALNYGFDFETRMLKSLPNPLQQIVFYFFFYLIPYVATLGLQRVTKGDAGTIFSPAGIRLIIFTFALLSLYAVMHNVPWFVLRYYIEYITSVPPDYQRYLARYASNFLPGVVVLGPLLYYWLKHDRHDSRCYGFSTSGISLRTYALLLLIVAPVVFVASFSQDFLQAYPRWKIGLPASFAGVEKWVAVGLFEVFYGVDFVFVELLFRGFMIMAFVRYLGTGAILPMVVVYAILHFQKPLGEAIGSIPGGLVLGVIAYNTKSIYGGVMLHLGVAYLMELAGTMQMLR